MITHTMELKMEDGHLQIPVDGFISMISRLPDNERKEFMKHLACDDQVIKDVAEQILTGWTEDGWHGPKTIDAQADTVNKFAHSIDRAAREVAKRSGEVAKREIERLEKALAESEERRNELEQRIYMHSRR